MWIPSQKDCMRMHRDNSYVTTPGIDGQHTGESRHSRAKKHGRCTYIWHLLDYARGIPRIVFVQGEFCTTARTEGGT